MSTNEKTQSALFEYEAVPKMSQAFPLAIQHVVAMIVGCVTPALIVSSAAGLKSGSPEQILLVQSSLVFAAISTIIMVFPIPITKNYHIGARLPMIIGVSFAYVSTMQSIARGPEGTGLGVRGLAIIFGAQVVGGIVAVIFGLAVEKIRKLFPPLIAGTVVFTVGLSLYPTAVRYMAGGSTLYSINGEVVPFGSWQYWAVAGITLIAVIFFNQFTKGFLKLASILMGLIIGYIAAFFFGMINFTSVVNAGIFQAPKLLPFGIEFDPSAAIAIALLFAVNSVQAIGDFSATTSGGMGRMPTDKELKCGITAYGLTNILSSMFGCLPTATYSQNVGIVATTKVVNRIVFLIAAVIILIAGLFPKFSALLTTIPSCVLGGATIMVFASIAMTGIKLVFTENMGPRNTLIVGLAVALGMGTVQVGGALDTFPAWAKTVFGSSPVVIATCVAIILNVVLPKEEAKK
ncbi:uracil-xanthine permease [Brachyspira hampsonii 30446]|uniref:Uracil-xanthine permease n=1 Tax=Brachyspira hampsonii 30446 TaxID=1289135 RepID=A0A2U4EUN7_9SPIR|nr:solute carrier family 23 protein [Brachyspira hampsonii]EKV56396.1 uracil-xanthine permease [Brachyspira hampsonii 30446]MBW5394483.1 purine permease [Brachyspira hampsonii]OEJ19841.1 uracil permease [Brachyspira hampsonii]PTY40294.1 uracil permease [Brachyspira hampsonii bv. II]